MRPTTRRGLLAAAIVAASPLLAGHSPYRRWHLYRQQRLVVVANGADGTAVRLGEAVARALATGLPESRALLATAASSPDVVALLRSAQLDLALLPADEAFGAFAGAPEFGGWPVALAALAVVESSLLHLVVRRDPRVRGVEDLAGRVIGVGAPGYRTDPLVERVLAAAGADAARRVALPAARAAAALREGTIDAFAWLDTAPSETVHALVSAPDLAVRLLDHGAVVARLAARHGPVYRPGAIPAGSYPGVTAEVRVAALPYLLVCRSAISDDEAHDVAAALGAAPADGSPLPPHPGLAHAPPARP